MGGAARASTHRRSSGRDQVRSGAHFTLPGIGHQSPDDLCVFTGKLEPAGPGNHGAHGIAGTLSFDRAISLVEKGVRFQTIGRVTALPASALQWVRTTEQETAHLDKLILNVALSYGGRAELVDAAKDLAQAVHAGRLTIDQIDEGVPQQGALYTRSSRPRPLDSHQRRNSNQQLSVMATGLYGTLLLHP